MILKMDWKLLILGLADIKVEVEWFLQISSERLIQPDACGNTS